MNRNTVQIEAVARSERLASYRESAASFMGVIELNEFNQCVSEDLASAEPSFRRTRECIARAIASHHRRIKGMSTDTAKLYLEQVGISLESAVELMTAYEAAPKNEPGVARVA